MQMRTTLALTIVVGVIGLAPAFVSGSARHAYLSPKNHVEYSSFQSLRA